MRSVETPSSVSLRDEMSWTTGAFPTSEGSQRLCGEGLPSVQDDSGDVDKKTPESGSNLLF